MPAIDLTPDSNHPTVRRLAGFSIKEDAGTPAAATVNLRDSTVSGQILVALELAGDESAVGQFSKPIPVEDGVYVEVVAGTISGVLYFA